MKENLILEKIKENIIKILPEIQKEEISIDHSLRDFGANSIDRVEIIMFTMEDLNLNIPRVEFGQAKNIRDIIAVFLNYMR